MFTIWVSSACLPYVICYDMICIEVDTRTAYSNATAYSENVMDIRDINVNMTRNAVHACDRLCTKMKFFVLQTGTNVPLPPSSVFFPPQLKITDM